MIQLRYVSTCTDANTGTDTSKNRDGFSLKNVFIICRPTIRARIHTLLFASAGALFWMGSCSDQNLYVLNYNGHVETLLSFF